MMLHRTKRNLFSIFLLFAALLVSSCGRSGHSDNSTASAEDKEPAYFYGIPVDSLNVASFTIKPNMFLANILMAHNLDYSVVNDISVNSEGVFDFRKIRAGHNYYILYEGDSITKPQYFIYDKSNVEYVVCDLRNAVCVYMGQKPIETREMTASGVIESSLYLTLEQNNLHPTLALSMANIYAWTIDFYHLQKGDRFKIIYEEQFVEGNSIGVSQIKAAVFEHYGRELFAIRYQTGLDSMPNYFDGDGVNLQKAFLKSPLEFGRLTSRYTNNRFHPVQKVNKAHKGTDYAAPAGTPIRATADGVVLEATYKKYNGNYVKIKHNSTYTTQYLHMSGFASGIRPGKHVRQGQTIGYVGSTGLATGPHVCYRFWKNGEQIDHTKEEVPPSNPVPANEMAKFNKIYKEYYERLASIVYPAAIPESIDSTLVASLKTN